VTAPLAKTLLVDIHLDRFDWPTLQHDASIAA